MNTRAGADAARQLSAAAAHRGEFTVPAPVLALPADDARAFDARVGVIVADRSPGWGLGSHAFVVGGIGKVSSDSSATAAVLRRRRRRA
jgi:hypothetical protein